MGTGELLGQPDRMLKSNLRWTSNTRSYRFMLQKLELIAGSYEPAWLKAAQDPCYHYLCIYLKSMHELRRLKPTANEIFMKFISKRSLYQ